MGNNSVIFTANYTAANPIESLNSYYGEYFYLYFFYFLFRVFSITTVDYKLQFIDMTYKYFNFL